MKKNRLAAAMTAVSMISTFIPVVASATPQMTDPGYIDITSEINPQVIGKYAWIGTSGFEATEETPTDPALDPNLMFDRDHSTKITMNRSTGPKRLGGFVLDAGEGKTFADVNEIDFACVNGTDIYIFGSNDNIAEAIENSTASNLCGTNYAEFNQNNLGIEVNKLSTAEVGWYNDGENNWGANMINEGNYRYLYIGTLQWNKAVDIKEIKLMHAPEASVTVNTQENCTVTFPDNIKAGENVQITVTPKEGYEVAKLNVGGSTVKPTIGEDGTAVYTISNAPAEITVDAWADPTENKLAMTAVTEKPEFDTITDSMFGTLPAAWSDNDATTAADFKSYGGLAIFDAGEGNRYKIDRVITYAKADFPGRAHLKIFGTNDELTADMFTTTNGANSGKLTALTHDNSDAFFGTGSYTNNKKGGTDAVRGDYAVNGDESYRYIIIHSDHKNMLSLSELKFYGKVRTAEEPDPTPTPAPESTVTVGTQENCTITYSPEKAEQGGTVTVTVTANEGYEPAKLNVNNATVSLTMSEDRKSATYVINNAAAELSLNAWADPTGRLTLNPVAEKPENLTTITNFGTLPAAWSDNDATTFGDFKSYGGLAIFDAGEGNRYKIDRVITYARANMPGRAHLKIFGTNEELTADMFSENNGANSGSDDLTALTHDNNNAYFGTGSYDNNKTSGNDAVRGDYSVNGDRSYRYIIIHSDHKNMLSLSELKFYGSVRGVNEPDPPTPAKVSIGAQENCKVTYDPKDVNVESNVTFNITADEGYEISKLKINSKLIPITPTMVDGKSTVSYTVKANEKVTVYAYADPADKLEMTALTEKPEGLDTIAEYGTIPSEWSDNNVSTAADFKAYPGMVIFDAGADYKYCINRVITYAQANYPARAHFKLYGTNETLTEDMFTAENGVNTESDKIDLIKHDRLVESFGSGSWENDKETNSTDPIREDAKIRDVKGYRYIILQSDQKNMLSLSELKFYGTKIGKDTPDPVKDERLVTYTAPNGVEISGTYTVKARPQGTGDDAWQDVDVYRVQLMSRNSRWAAMAYFDCTGPTEVQVTCTGGGDGIDNIENGLNAETKLYPKSYGIEPEFEVGGNVITFTVNPGQRIVLDPNDDSRRDLHIWADEPIDIPSVDEVEAQGKTVEVIDAEKGDNLHSSDADVVFVRPGFYAGDFSFKNDQICYIDGGAVINGSISLDYTTNAKLIGRGMTYRPPYAAITVNDAVNAHVEGMMGLNHGFRDGGGYFLNIANSKNVYIKNLKSIGRHKWGDSIDIFCSEDVTMEGLFMRGNDDCIAIYGPRWTGSYWGDTGNVRNIKVKDSVLMPDVARPIHLGTHGDSASPNGGRVIDNCRFENIDILTYSKYAPGPQPIRIDDCEGNKITNIYFDNIRIQDGRANMICDFFITIQGRYGTNTFNGKGINNIYFKDVTYDNLNGTSGGKIQGANNGKTGITQNVTFENLVVNGQVAHNSEEAGIWIGDKTKNINFVESGESSYVYNPAIVPEDIWPTYYDYARTDGVTVSADATAEGSADASAVLDDDDTTVWYSPVSETGSSYDGTAKTVTGDGITVNLGAQRHISNVRLTWADPSKGHDYRIYVSKDGVDWSAGHTDEHGVGAVNSKSRGERNRKVKTTWFVNQYDPRVGQDYIVGQYIKIIPQKGTSFDMAKLEVFGEERPESGTVTMKRPQLDETGENIVLMTESENGTEFTDVPDDSTELADLSADNTETITNTAPNADTGAVGNVSNGGEWSIYASKSGTGRSTAIEDASEKGVIEVTGSNGISSQLQFDLSTMLNNSVVSDDKVIKDAKLRLTPMDTRSGINHGLFVINNNFTTTNGKKPIAEFEVPKGNGNDFFADDSVISLTPEELNEYPSAISAWQTNIDVTGEAITALDNKLSLQIEYSDGDESKTEYATSNISANGRLNGGVIPLLYNSGATEYSKWIYPQIVVTYTDSQTYKDAYADFISAYNKLKDATVTETDAVTLDSAENGSEITIEMNDTDESSPIKAENNSLTINDEYVGSDTATNVKLTVTKTDGEETAVYSCVVSVGAVYESANIISFDGSKNPKGQLSVISSGKTYTDGMAYAKPEGIFYIDAGANTGYNADIVVKDSSSDEIIEANDEGGYTMPDGDVEISVEYFKETYGTTRIAATNSISIKNNGKLQGNSEDAPNLVIGGGRITFVKFDLSEYNINAINDVDISFNAWNTANTKAVFYVPNNDWSEDTISSNFCIDGTDKTNISSFKTDDDQVVSLINNEEIGSLIIPNAEGEDNAANAANGILKDYYLGSTGTSKTASFDVTEAIKKVLSNSSDKIITLMIYSTGGGNDASSTMYADSISARPSLEIVESAENLPDDEVITKIETADDLVRFAELVRGGNSYKDKTVTLVNDVDISNKLWIPIGTINDEGKMNAFAGTFDGGNHSITGLNINNSTAKIQGLFGAVTGVVKDLTVEGEINSSSVVGGIAAFCSGKITNCHSRVNIIAQREAGGIVGTLANGGIVENSDNAGNITLLNKETYAGGIAGHNIMSVVDNCTNTGNVVNDTDGFRNRLGGIVGFLDNGTISNSDNAGNVTSDAEVAPYTADTTQNYVGGIIGYASYSNVTNCSNSGEIHNEAAFTGGIAGCLQIGCLLSNCTNSGKSSGKDYVGGIVGYNISTIDTCTNLGVVEGNEKTSGKIAGYFSRGLINNSTNDEDTVGFNAYGKITQQSAIEGITVTLSENLVFNGNEQVLAVVSGIQDNDKVTYMINNKTVSELKSLNAGKYSIIVKISREGYADYRYSGTVNIAKATAVISAQPKQSVQYDGFAKTVEASLNNTEGTLKYLITDANGNAVTEMVDPGKYMVEISAAETNNYNASEPITVEFEIIKQNKLPEIVVSNIINVDNSTTADVRIDNPTPEMEKCVIVAATYGENGSCDTVSIVKDGKVKFEKILPKNTKIKFFIWSSISDGDAMKPLMEVQEKTI